MRLYILPIKTKIKILPMLLKELTEFIKLLQLNLNLAT